MEKKVAVLICSLLIGLAPWAVHLGWNELLQPQNFWVGVPIAAGIVLAWLGTSPIKPKQ